MMSLERLRTLHAVATYGSVTAAADTLHLTASAVSQQLAKLERETGHTLLEPNGRGVRLTGAAQLLVEHAGRILSLVEEAQADLEAHRDQVIGHVTIAVFATAARGIMPQLLRAARERYPRLRVELLEIDMDDSLPLLARGDLDAALYCDWVNSPLALADGLSGEHLLDDPIDLVLPADHPMAGHAQVSLAELAGADWIAWTKGSICYDWLRQTLRGEGVEPRIAHTAEEHQTQLALVAAGLGAAVIPRMGRDPVPNGVRVVAVAPTLRRRCYVAWRTGTERRPALRGLLDLLRTHARTA
ncbi:LysR family transcriptional regulator [Actinocatenispora sera]|uniref:LysR family transcriptional regulator n=1 Tax=Actinocatenispora sera TaxID=390989 RepID=A0A810L445_9ACTN|nr:LysR family transcriptional regulator [Actinocatenispora sera]BCJ28898.1 LysR family transcriptional regulator [Actinocatenispora sera]